MAAGLPKFMTNKRLIIISAVVVAIAALQILVFCCRPKIEYNAQTADKAEIQTRDVSLALERTVPESVSEPVTEAAAPAVALNLELVGTAVGNAKDPIAFIKNLDTNRQGIYKIGNMIDDAKVIRIAKGVVDLDVKGKLMTIEVKNRRAQNTPPATGAIVSVSDDEVVMSRWALLSQAGSILASAKKMRIEPYSEANKVVGMKVQGVDAGSIIEQAGIHNQDVLTSINNQKIDSYQKALQVFNKARKQSEIKISLLREGELRQVSYRFEN
jgi:type II secretion system protein C